MPFFQSARTAPRERTEAGPTGLPLSHKLPDAAPACPGSVFCTRNFRVSGTGGTRTATRPDPFVAERIRPRTTDIRSGSVQSSLTCPTFRKDFRGPKGGEAQRARPEEKKTPFRIQQTAYGFSTPFSEEPQGNGYKTNKPGKRKREKPPCHRRQHAVSGALYGTPCGQRLTTHDIPPRPLQGRLSRRAASLTPSDPLRHRILRPNFRTAKKTRTGISLRPDRRPAAAYRKNIRGNRPVSQYADILVVRPPSPVRAFSGTALSESEGIRPSLPCGRGGGPADRYTRSAPRPTRY